MSHSHMPRVNYIWRAALSVPSFPSAEVQKKSVQILFFVPNSKILNMPCVN